MKKVIVFACMSLFFTATIHAAAIKGNKNCKRTIKKITPKKNTGNAQWGCISTLMSGTAGHVGAVYMFVCAGPGPCAPSAADQCFNSSTGNHTTMSFVTVQP